jgi:hypothetical protein
MRPMAPPIPTEEREREAADLELLEELWAAPAAGAPGEPRLRTARVWAGEHIGWILSASWLLFVASLFGAPAGDPNAVVPLWAEALVAGFFLALGTTGILAAVRAGTSVYVASTVSGLFGLGLAVACAATDHHAAGWWTYELAGTFALTALSVAGLRRSRRT